jgi:predicted dehydrogenase
MIRFGVVGFGYWGPNIVRNLTLLSETSVDMICDLHADALTRAKKSFPHVLTTRHFNDVLKSKRIDAVAIVTPVSSHYELAKKALLNGKHVFIEKPFTSTVKEAEELIALAAKKKLKLMVDHTFLFTGAVQKIKELIDHNALGDLYYYDSTRVSLGLFQQDTNVIWDLAPHDFSIINYVIKNKPLALSAQGMDHMGSGHENIAFITIYFARNLIAHVNINWLSPVKIRTTLIGGEKKMLLWDDLEVDEKIKIYDKGVDRKTPEGIYKLKVDYRSGDMHAPRLEHGEALTRELTYFADCIKHNKQPINDGHAGLNVVKMLELSNQSLRQKGKLLKF